MTIWLIPALIFAFLEAIAVSRNLQRLEYVAKPAVMICLFLWLYTATSLQGNALWFGLGVLLSLVGDVLLMFASDRFFLLGLAAFLLTHLFYIVGFREAAANISAWSLIWLAFIAINASRLIRRIVEVMRLHREDKLVLPVVIYGIVISIMLYAAMSTIYDQSWKTSAAFFVSLGAILFVASDAILAWMRFVSPVKNGRVWNIALYYLGQIGIIAGVITQFG
ncbi:MAG TPA: lysoplasmalogenase [Anaerolineales bacterium]|nr:lysoplasmalogenase [Anaerolineales bacterium]